MDMPGFALQTIARAIENAVTNFMSSRKKPNASVALECIVWERGLVLKFHRVY